MALSGDVRRDRLTVGAWYVLKKPLKLNIGWELPVGASFQCRALYGGGLCNGCFPDYGYLEVVVGIEYAKLPL